MLIDIILLTYNNLFNTKECIKSLYKYTFNFKLVIIDNGSTDDTVSYLKSLLKEKDNIILSLQKENLGIIKGRNLGYNLTIQDGSELVCFIDNDQLVSRNWLESYLLFIEKGYDIVGSESWQMKENFYPSKKVTSKDDYFNYCGAGGMVLKRKIIEDIGLFDEQFNPMYFEDPDFDFRSHDKGYKIGWNTEKKIFHKPHKLLGGKGDRVFYFRRNWVRFREKWKVRELPFFKME